MKRVLVIVVTYNGMKWLDRCLGSVCHQGAVMGPNDGPMTAKMAQNAVMGPASGPMTAVGVDLYVWDNDSTDGSADFVAANYPGAKLVRSADNLGFSRPNNMGMQYAVEKGYDYVYLLNQDAWLEPGALEILVSAAEANPEYGVLSPLQMTDGYYELDRQFAKFYHCSEGGTCPGIHGHPRPCKREGPAGGASGRGLSEAKAIQGHVPPSEPEQVKFVMAAHWMVRVSAIKKVGLFNEDLFPLYGQDEDWCQRLDFCGLKVGVVKEARAVHDRAYREEPVEKLVLRNYYTGALVKLVNPKIPLAAGLCYVFALTLVKSFKYRSLLPFKYLRRIFKEMPQVHAHRGRVSARV